MALRKSVLSIAVAGVTVFGGGIGAAEAQSAPAVSEANGGWVAPRNEYGQPDLQGNWSNATLTPLVRQPGQGLVMSAEQVWEIEGGVRALYEQGAQASDPNRPPPPAGGNADEIPESVITARIVAAGGGTGVYNTVYIDSGDRVAVVNGEPRSSLITFPADGRIPPITAEARDWRAEQSAIRQQFGAYDHPELRPLAERCMMSFGSNAGPPMLPNGWYNNNYTIVQNADHVLIMTEMIHDARIIRLGDGPRLPDHVRPWMGDSWGHWEGETLVVETTNIHPSQRFQGNSSDNQRVIERFTRVDAETILYEFTIDDPAVYTAPWGGQVPMKRLDDRLYEYACHEGNYSLQNILSGARYEERQAAGERGATP